MTNRHKNRISAENEKEVFEVLKRHGHVSMLLPKL